MSSRGPTSPAVRISGTGHYVPERVMTNHDLEKIVDTSDEWITQRTGIRERRIAAPNECTSDMAAEAAKRAIEAAGISPEEIDLILVGTVTPDAPLPSTAMYVQQKIGARDDCPGFDLAAACAGFIYGLSIAEKFVVTGAARHVLVIGAEMLSRFLDWEDRTTCVLFGDGAGAAVVSPALGDGTGVLSTHIYGKGSQAEALTIPGGGTAEPASSDTISCRRHFVKMEGKYIFKYAVQLLASASVTALEHNNLKGEDIDWVVPHQANLRILDGVADRCGVPIERFYLNLDRFGNTSSASVPIALDEAVRAGIIKPGQTLLSCALGGGLAWGSAVIRW